MAHIPDPKRILFLILCLFSYTALADQACIIKEQPKPWDYYSSKAIEKNKDWKNAETKTDYWMLALSWSKAFCDKYKRGRIPRNKKHQCVDNQFSLVVHGLWAQSRKAKNNIRQHPRNCRDTPAMSAATLSAYFCYLPGRQLMQKTWEKHGSCDFAKPIDYLRKTKFLYDQLILPSREELEKYEYSSKREVANMLLQRNLALGLKKEHFIVQKKNGRLREIRFCYDLNYRFVNCT